MSDDVYEKWLAWSRANPEPEMEPACECERKDAETRAALSRLTPEMIEAVTLEIFGKKK